MRISDTLSLLVGSWELRRSIIDHRDGTAASFTGRAVISMAGSRLSAPPAVPDRALYHETGRLRVGSYTGGATRHLEYRRVDPGTVMIHFADGRPFVDLDLRGGRWRSVHHCGDDLYVMVTTVRSERHLEEIWQVRGPTKSYDATTDLHRAET